MQHLLPPIPTAATSSSARVAAHHWDVLLQGEGKGRRRTSWGPATAEDELGRGSARERGGWEEKRAGIGGGQTSGDWVMVSPRVATGFVSRTKRAKLRDAREGAPLPQIAWPHKHPDPAVIHGAPRERSKRSFLQHPTVKR